MNIKDNLQMLGVSRVFENCWMTQVIQFIRSSRELHSGELVLIVRPNGESREDSVLLFFPSCCISSFLHGSRIYICRTLSFFQSSSRLF